MDSALLVSAIWIPPAFRAASGFLVGSFVLAAGTEEFIRRKPSSPSSSSRSRLVRICSCTSFFFCNLLRSWSTTRSVTTRRLEERVFTSGSSSSSYSSSYSSSSSRSLLAYSISDGMNGTRNTPRPISVKSTATNTQPILPMILTKKNVMAPKNHPPPVPFV